MIMYIIPLLIVILSNTVYHLVSKNIASTANTFLVLSATYGTSFISCIVLYFITKQQSLIKDLSGLKLGSFLLGIVIIGLEGGYLLMYQHGWEISKGSLVANISVACVLFLIGFLIFKEEINLYKILGLCSCLIGIVLMNLK
ncbi:MAG: EamA family transporter [Eubacteriales bacterium]|nr:EamA family transporter [Eubacteriales bacterium]